MAGELYAFRSGQSTGSSRPAPNNDFKANGGELVANGDGSLKSDCPDGCCEGAGPEYLLLIPCSCDSGASANTFMIPTGAKIDATPVVEHLGYCYTVGAKVTGLTLVQPVTYWASCFYCCTPDPAPCSNCTGDQPSALIATHTCNDQPGPGTSDCAVLGAGGICNPFNHRAPQSAEYFGHASPCTWSWKYLEGAIPPAAGIAYWVFVSYSAGEWDVSVRECAGDGTACAAIAWALEDAPLRCFNGVIEGTAVLTNVDTVCNGRDSLTVVFG